MDRIVAAVERFRVEMERAGILVSGFEVADDLQREKLEAMAAGFTVPAVGKFDCPSIVGLRIVVKGAKP